MRGGYLLLSMHACNILTTITKYRENRRLLTYFIPAMQRCYQWKSTALALHLAVSTDNTNKTLSKYSTNHYTHTKLPHKISSTTLTASVLIFLRNEKRNASITQLTRQPCLAFTLHEPVLPSADHLLGGGAGYHVTTRPTARLLRL
jgi:hypothetical protein